MKVLVPVDGTAFGQYALPALAELVQRVASDVTLLLVAKAPKATVRRGEALARPLLFGALAPPAREGAAYIENLDQAVERREHELLEYLDRLALTLRDTGVLVEGAVRFGEPSAEIIDFARRGAFDLIVMATHGRFGLRGVLQPSVTAAIVRSGVAPVVAVRSQARASNRGAPVEMAEGAG